ncbi:HPF/RaiA family ribosome-associated protein [Luteimonas vadosa]|uniref:HPF/RaiA family ribosome-associated protein n=1 Tax=Luteimonas vadosa TaxID=1165507 RepID=A0ABP9E410_9GAMM
MKIQLNTDNHVEGHAALESRVVSMVEQHLGRFSERLSRIEVFLSDSNAAKGGADDKRCALEARIEHERPIGVSHDDENMEKAIRGACDKLKTRLEAVLDKQRRH